MTAVATELWDDAARRRLVRLCARLSGDREAAEDLAQETLLEAWRNAHKLVDPAGSERWLAAIARNVCLRWGRSRGREPARVDGADVEAVADRAAEPDLADLLALLGPEARELFFRRYVHGASPAEIAAVLGVSEDAVSMRLSRGKAQLRRLLAPEEWRETRVWCSTCGARRLLQLSEADAISFRCPGCNAGSLSHHVDLRNPFFARLVGDASRPTTVLGRLAAWSRAYFAGGTGAGSCTGCGGRVAIGRDPERTGLRATCASCGRAVSSSVQGIAGALPEMRAFRRAHPRTRLVHVGDVEHAGVGVTLVRCEDVAGNARLDALFARDTLRLLAVA
jgi:RNA polymerase sigma factor (sigma-70 family)